MLKIKIKELHFSLYIEMVMPEYNQAYTIQYV